MKTPQKYLTVFGLALAALTWPLLKVSSTEEEEAHAKVEFKLSSTEEERAQDFEEGIAAREDFRHMQLQDENGEIPPNAWIEAYEQKEAMEFLPEAWSEFVPAGTEVPSPWVSIGPGNIGGRIRSIIVHPTATPRTIWVGGVSGGVWKTTNGGASWSTNTDFLPNLGIGCMAIDPANPNILYAGTGEVFRGNGIYKTTNGGSHWAPLLSTTNNPSFYAVNRLAISPPSTNPQVLLAATGSGVFRSTDGGQQWSSSPTLPNTRWADVCFKPVNPPEPDIPDVPSVNCLASSYDGRLYYSADYGATWATSNLPALGGRVELAYSRSSPWIVYASVGVGRGVIFRSENRGFSFSRRGEVTGLPGPNGYANALWVDPTNPETILAGGVYLLRSTNGGQTWDEASSNSTHPDHHVIVEDPGYNAGSGTTPNKTVYGGNDGGIHRTTDILATASPAPSVVWTSLNNSLGITQFYGGAGHVASGTIIGGTQDNGTLRSPQPGSPNWTMIFGDGIGGDGGFCAVDQSDEPYYYGEFFNLQIHRSVNSGFSKQYIWYGIPTEGCGGVPCANSNAPFILDPNNRNRILAGGLSLWRSNNAREFNPLAVAWAEIKSPIPGIDNQRYVSAIAVAQGNSDLIWVGHNNSSVYYTTNGTSTTPSWTQVGLNVLPSRGCARITIGPSSQTPRRVYATFAGFGSDSVWKTEDNGGSWTDISGIAPRRLPNIPVFSLVVSPSNPNIFYIGTEIGVFATANGGESWSPGVPGAGGPTHAVVMELFWMGPKLVAVTHGRGMFTLTPPSQ